MQVPQETAISKIPNFNHTANASFVNSFDTVTSRWDIALKFGSVYKQEI